MIRLCGIALLAGAASVILNGVNKEMTKLLSAAAALILILTAITAVTPVISELSALVSSSELSEYTVTLLRALGIAYITELTAEICRTCGADSAAVGISIAGRAELSVIAAGFMFELLSLSLSFL